MAARRMLSPGCRYGAGYPIQLLEEDLAMSERVPEPGNAGDQAEVWDTAEFAKMREVMRASEKHREGGVDSELEDEEPDPGT